MDTKVLLEQANDHVLQVNKLMREIEDSNSIIQKVHGWFTCMGNGKETVYIHGIISPEKSKEINEIVEKALNDAHLAKKMDLELLLGKGTEQKKATFVKPEIEQVSPVDPEPEPSEEQPKRTELTVGLVKRLYHEKDMTLEQIAKETGNPRSSVFTFINKNGLRKPSKKEKEVFRDSQVVAAKKKPS